jgi:hypothetical protein
MEGSPACMQFTPLQHFYEFAKKLIAAMVLQALVVKGDSQIFR